MKSKKILCATLALMVTVFQTFPSMAINDTNKLKKSISTSIENNNINNNVDNNSYPKAVNPTDIVYIPDPDLKAAINKLLDITREEGQDVTKADMENLTMLANKFSSKNNMVHFYYAFSDFTGLEYAINLETINIQGDENRIFNISNIDQIENLTNLEDISFEYCNFTDIDMTKNTNLLSAYFNENTMGSIKVSNNNTVLESLEATNNNLNTIDLGQNNSIMYLDLSNNNLNTIDLNGSSSIEYLDLSNNNLNTIELNGNTNLVSLYIDNNNLDTIDVSNNTVLEALDLSNNNLDDIDLSGNNSITYLNLSNNSLDTIDVSNITKLTTLYINNNNLSSIDLSSNIDLEDLDINNNNLNTIDLSNNISLLELDISNNRLNSIDVSKNKIMKILKATNNNISVFVTNDELIRYDLRDQTINIDSSKVIVDSNNNIEVENIIKYNNIPVFDITGQGVTYNKHNNRVTIDPSINTNITYDFEYSIYKYKVFSGTVHVNKTDVESVSLSSNQSTLEVGNNILLTQTITPNNATNKQVKWSSSNDKIATVDQNGNVTAISVGTATITVTTMDGNKTATCTITVTPKSVTGVNISDTNTSLNVGSVKPLTAEVLPANATNKKVTWSSSDNNIATVNENGIVTGVNIGTATITVTTEDGNKTATCVVEVTPVKVSYVSISEYESTINVGDKKLLNAKVSPANATDKSVTWSSSDTSVATVDQNGNVTAVSPGVAIITVTTTDGNRTSSSKITVVKPVTSISLSDTNVTLDIDNSKVLSTTISPTDATNKNVIWESSNPSIATVDQNGNVTAISAGTATITVKTEDGNKTATCDVTVNPKKVTGIDMVENSNTVNLGENITLTAIISPANATDKVIIWESSDPSIATVDQNGNVTTIRSGMVNITARTRDGGYSKTSTITVDVPVNDKVYTNNDVVANNTLASDNNLDSNNTIDSDNNVVSNDNLDSDDNFVSNNSLSANNNLVSDNNKNLSLNNENPKKGVKGIFNILGLGLLGCGSLFIIKKRKTNKNK